MSYFSRLAVYVLAVVISAQVRVAHADAASDLLSALEAVAPVTSSSVVVPTTQASVAAAPAPVSSVIPMSLEDLNQDPRIPALKQQIADLTKILLALVEAKRSTAAAPHVSVSSPEAATTCSLSRTLSRTMKGEDVSLLQRFLIRAGLLEGDSATGYFGQLTENAVQRWQADNGVVAQGSPETTGYGVVGLKTRAVMQQMCQASTDETIAAPQQDVVPLVDVPVVVMESTDDDAMVTSSSASAVPSIDGDISSLDSLLGELSADVSAADIDSEL